MALVTNGFTTYDSKRNRETFSDLISLITPDETPLYSLIRKESLDGTHPEWSTDTLATPVTTNKNFEGDTYAYSAVTATARIGNYCQISTKQYIITETQEAVLKAGPKSEIGRQRAKKGVELRCDIEAAMLSNNASIAGATGTARQSGGMRAWLATNDSFGATGASGGFNAGTGVVDAATPGTQRGFTKTLLDDTIELTYKAGGNPTVLMLSPYAKRIFSTFMSDSNVAAFRTPLTGKSQGTIVGAADCYLSDFGMVDVVPNRQMVRASGIALNAYLITPDKLAKGFLRDIQEDRDAAKVGDAIPRVLKAEWSLVVKNEAAHGVIADIFGTTASS
jgi:Family of unknown function (DUF5309)